MTRQRIAKRHRQRGISLIELMVGLTLGLLLLTALGSLYFSTTQSRSEFSNSAEQVENGRYVVDTVGREIELAGFFGAASVASGATVASPALCATTPGALGFVSAPATVPLGLQGYAPGTVAPCLPNLAPTSEIVVIRRVSTTPAAVATTGQSYIQVSFCSSDATPFVFDASAPAFTMRTKACDPAVAAELRPAVVRIFYLAACDVCSGAGDGLPTLKMAELSSGAFQVNSVAQDIQDMHLSYGVDLDNNGSADCYVSDPGVNNSAICTSVPAYDWTTALTNWQNVTSVRINVLARTRRASLGWTDSRTYDLGRATVSGPFNDGFKRHVYARVARLVNVAGRRE
ncbi:PilW family protein [Cupriavidus sp. CuC1]|uniref:PilW family protein n=1 Tax=Cupriavidus sp. CuC1 TaxID=3373131 RepID=UPI0037CCDF40